VLAEHPAARRVTISSPACNGDITYNNGTPSAKRRTLGQTRVLSLSRFPFLLSTDDLDQMVAEALDWDPVFFDTDPVYAVVFALHCERRQVKFPRLRFILTSYEYTSVLHQRILERVFGVPVYNLYGSTETGHLLMEQATGGMVASRQIAHLDVIHADDRGIGRAARVDAHQRLHALAQLPDRRSGRAPPLREPAATPTSSTAGCRTP
jgi:phenylacetate-CoA ligase